MAPEATLSIEVVCDRCKRERNVETQRIDVFFEMKPKVEADPAVPFYLCVKCWLDHDGFDGPARASASVVEPTPLPVAILPPAPAKKTKNKRTNA